MPDEPIAALVITHGFGEHSGRYSHMIDHMISHNIAVIAIDLEGHGQSGAKKGVCENYDVLKADVDLMLEHARTAWPTLPVFLYGHSMGGGVVLNYVLSRRPDTISGVIASAPLIHPTDPVPGFLRAIVKLLRPVLPGMTLKNAILGDQISTLPDEQARYAQDTLNHDRLGLGLAVDIIEGGEWVAANAGAWNVPLLLMHARGDQLTRFDSAEIFAQAADKCTFIPIEQSEHEIHNDVHRDDVYAHILDFIRTHT